MLAALKTEVDGGVQLLRGGELRAGAVSFETDDEVYAWPVEALGVIKAAVPHPAEDDAAEQARRCDAIFRLGLGTDAPVQFFEPQLLPSDPGAPGATAVNVADAVDRALWIAVLHVEGMDPTALARDMAGHSLFLGVAFDEAVDRPFRLDDLTAAGAAGFRSSGLDADLPPTLWRLWSADGTAADPAGRGRGHHRGLTTTGVVALTLPDPLPVAAAPPPSGSDSPPRLDDAAQAARVLVWLQATRPDGVGGDPIHRVRWVGANGVQATQARSIAAPELLGTGTGGAGAELPRGAARDPARDGRPRRRGVRPLATVDRGRRLRDVPHRRPALHRGPCRGRGAVRRRRPGPARAADR